MVPPLYFKMKFSKSCALINLFVMIGVPMLCAVEHNFQKRKCNPTYFLHDINYMKNICEVSESTVMPTEEYLDNMNKIKDAAKCLIPRILKDKTPKMHSTINDIFLASLHRICPMVGLFVNYAKDEVRENIIKNKQFSGYTPKELEFQSKKLEKYHQPCIDKDSNCKIKQSDPTKLCSSPELMFCRKSCLYCFNSDKVTAERFYQELVKNDTRMEKEAILNELRGTDAYDNPGSEKFHKLKAHWNVRGSSQPNLLVQDYENICVEDECKKLDLEECQTLFHNKVQHVYSAKTKIKEKFEHILVIMKTEHKDCDYFTPIWDSNLLKECSAKHFGAELVLSYRGTNGYLCPSTECKLAIGNLRPLVVNLLGTANYHIEYDRSDLSGKVSRSKIIHLTMPDDRKSAKLKIRCGDLEFERHVYITPETYCRSNFPATKSGQFAAAAVCVYYRWFLTLILVICIVITVWVTNKLTGGRAMLPIAVILTIPLYPFYKLAYRYFLCKYCCNLKLPNHQCPIQCVCGTVCRDKRQLQTHHNLCREVNKTTFARIVRHLKLSNLIYIIVIFIIAQLFILMYINIEYLADDYITSKAKEIKYNAPLIIACCLLASRYPKFTLAVILALLFNVSAEAQPGPIKGNKTVLSPKHLSAEEMRKAKDLEWLSVVKEVLKTDTESILKDNFHPASLEIKTNGIIYSGLNLDSMEHDGTFTSGSILAQVPMAEGSAIGYNIQGPEGSKPVPLIIYIRRSRVIRDYTYTYSTFPETGSTVTQNEDCVQGCDVCYSELAAKSWEASWCWNEVQHWGCEKSNCAAINAGALCMACTAKYDEKEGADVYRFSTQKSLIELCIKLNSNTYCREFDRLDSLDGKDFGVLVSLVPTSADLMSKDYLVYYRKKKTWFTDNKVCGWNAVECSDFGNPQYSENDKGMWLNNFRGDIDATWDCVAIGSKVIHVNRCFKNTFTNINGLLPLNRHTEINQTRSGKTGYPGKVTVSQNNLYLGVGTVKLRLDKLIYTEMETTGDIKIKVSACTGCYNCKLGLSCRFEFITTVIGRLTLSCKGGIVRHPDIGLIKTGTTSMVKILDITIPEGKINCQAKSKGVVLSSSSTTFKASLGDPTVYVQQKVDPTISTDITKNCGFICSIKSAFSFSSWFNALKAIGILIILVIIAFVGTYLIYFLVKACMKMKSLAKDIKKDYDQEKQE